MVLHLRVFKTNLKNIPDPLLCFSHTKIFLRPSPSSTRHQLIQSSRHHERACTSFYPRPSLLCSELKITVFPLSVGDRKKHHLYLYIYWCYTTATPNKIARKMAGNNINNNKLFLPFYIPTYVVVCSSGFFIYFSFHIFAYIDCEVWRLLGSRPLLIIRSKAYSSSKREPRVF